MNSPQPQYASILEAVQEAPDLAEVGLLATILHAEHDPNLGRWFQASIQSRYRTFTRPGLPDGPPYLDR